MTVFSRVKILGYKVQIKTKFKLTEIETLAEFPLSFPE